MAARLSQISLVKTLYLQFTEIIFYVRSISVTNQHLKKKDTFHIRDLLVHLKAKLNFGSLELLNIPMKE